ncbi:MAG: MotA/TolQ/ExbB proton channel family protein [Myxococcales bacterium]|nr:MotA/TolQ/ExbB proton channel family protein [Myxococcota bacterium]MDW8282014.1 MotA/TolQ/ExbB proton channel family protein [Myxococcales bacterium]
MFDLLLAGGPFMFATLGISIGAVAIILQRLYTLWVKYRLPGPAYLKQVLDLSESGSYPQALQLCSMNRHPLMRILKSALVRADRSEKDIRRAVEAQAAVELPTIRALTAYLPHLANLATLCGLLGTIHGLIVSFQGIGNTESTAARQAMLAKGIAIAFYNTFFGLAVAVGTVFAYMIISGRQSRILTAMEQATTRLVDHLASQRTGAQRRGATA